jgi:hypothetical protein
LDRWLPEVESLSQAICAWQAKRTQPHPKINGPFSTDLARVKLKR